MAANEGPNVFDGSQFDAVTLTERVTKIPHVPGRIGELGIFQTAGIRTTDLRITLTDKKLALLPYGERGGPDTIMNSDKRRSVRVETAHFTLKRTITPSEIQNVMNAAEDDLVTNAMSVVDEKAADMVPTHDATLEFQRLGAMRGILLDSDGQTIVEDFFDRFKLTPQSLDFELDNVNTDVRRKCLDAKGMIEANLGGGSYTVIRALVGSEFFRAFISHPSVVRSWERYQEGTMLRNDVRYSGFEYGGIFWEEYRGKVAGIDFVEEEEAHIYPIGVNGMYITRFAPADMMEFVNTVGKPRYMSMERKDHGRGYEVLTESDPISVNTRPDATLKGTK
ncbi:MAG: major capsid protein [Alphaproteobacteria bacterium]|nr:MAG: major capsid protein [Alphaproteobacteria bacterium]